MSHLTGVGAVPTMQILPEPIRGNNGNEAYVSAQQPEAEEDAWLSRPDADQGWPGRHRGPPPEGTQAPRRLIASRSIGASRDRVD